MPTAYEKLVEESSLSYGATTWDLLNNIVGGGTGTGENVYLVADVVVDQSSPDVTADVGLDLLVEEDNILNLDIEIVIEGSV